jgi:hypothetical protein
MALKLVACARLLVLLLAIAQAAQALGAVATSESLGPVHAPSQDSSSEIRVVLSASTGVAEVTGRALIYITRDLDGGPPITRCSDNQVGD